MLKTYQKPKHCFENRGWVIPDDSYHVILENVTNTENENIRKMVNNNKGRYFTIFAQRQSGKITFFMIFADLLKPIHIILLSY